MVLNVIFGTFLLFIGSINAQNQYCQPFQSNVLQSQLPALSSEFAVLVEANFISKGYSFDAFQVYDYNNSRGAVVMTRQNIEFRFIFNYAQNEIYLTEKIAADPRPPQYCVSQKLTEAPETALFFQYVQVDANTIRPADVNTVLRFPKDGQYFNGSETIRGIPCDVYLSCQISSDQQTSYIAKFYFSKKGYSMPYTNQDFPQVPVRVELNGISNKVPFRTIYEYHEFNPSINQYTRSFFQTPTGLYCKDRKVTKPTPPLSQRYAYSEEIVRFQSITNLNRVYYDSLFQLVRFDVRSTLGGPETLYVKNRLAIINDYKIGVSYYRNLDLGNCTIKALGSNNSYGLDQDQNYTQSQINQGFGFSVRLKSPSSFLLLDSDYAFTGERFENSIPVDVFITNHTDTIQGVTFSSIQEYAFRMPFTVGNNPATTQKTIPVRLNLIGASLDDSAQFNYFNFADNLPDYSAFDLGACYPTDKKINFRLEFPYRNLVTEDQLTNNYVRYIEQFLYFVLSVKFNETAVRFAPPKIQVSGRRGVFYAQSAIMPPVPDIALFTKIQDQLLIFTSYNLTEVDSDEACARYCNTIDGCLSFDYCPSTKRCYANKKHTTDSQVQLTNSTVCSHYSRSVDPLAQNKPSDAIWLQLQNTVALGLFIFEIPIPALAFKPVNFTASSVDQLFENDRFGATSLLSRYNLRFAETRYLTAKDREYSGLSVDECAARCSGERAFSCESFDYCSIDGSCRISKYPAVDITDMTPSKTCDIYEKDAVYHYTALPFQVTVNKNDIKVNADSASQCARECDATTKIHCRGFNYCETTKTCYLTETHLLDGTSSGQLDLKCIHYTRNYLKDFTFTATANISTDRADLSLSDSSAEECARSCVGADSFSCKSFDYCQGSRKCLLNSFTNSNTTKPSDTNIESCDNYYREYFYLTSQTVNLNFPKTKDNSESTLIGLSITFSVAGLVGGLAIFFFVLPKFLKK